MKSIEQYYNKARRSYIFMLSIFVITPISALGFFIPFLFIPNTNAAYILFSAFIISSLFSILLSFIIMLEFFSKKKVMKYYVVLYDKFPKTDKSLLLLLCFYLIQNKKIYSLEKSHYFNKQLSFTGKLFRIKYNKETDEKKVGEILQYAKNINI